MFLEKFLFQGFEGFSLEKDAYSRFSKPPILNILNILNFQDFQGPADTPCFWNIIELTWFLVYINAKTTSRVGPFAGDPMRLLRTNLLRSCVKWLFNFVHY